MLASRGLTGRLLNIILETVTARERECGRARKGIRSYDHSNGKQANMWQLIRQRIAAAGDKPITLVLFRRV